MTVKRNRGFSLLELLATVAIGFTMVAVALMTMMPALKQDHLDQAYYTTLSTMRLYRSQAINQDNRYILTFTTPGTITVQLWGYALPTSPAPTFVASYALPSDIQFAVQTGFPSTGPDSLGGGTTAIGFNPCNTIESGSPCLIFYPDGSVQDDQGNYNSGIIYLTSPSNNIYSSRAIDVFGTTGRIRGWRLYNQSGSNVWVQQ